LSDASPPAGLPSIPNGPPLLVVLSGPSGAGKDAVRDLLMAWKLPVHFVVTATTRPMRPGERNGADYWFVTDAEFDRMEAADELIEKAIVYGQRKGVPRREIVEPLSRGADVIARVDVQGAMTLRGIIPDALLIFIASPSLEEEQRRLDERATESEEERRLRLETAQQEIEAVPYFDHVVVNETGRLESTARRVVELIVQAKQRRGQR
jgi:guanylate kinase